MQHAESYLDGGPLPVPEVRSLVGLLPRAAGLNGSQALCFVADDGSDARTSYAELLDDAARVLSGLREHGVAGGERIILQIADEHELLTAFWACVLGGFVPVPVAAAGGEGAVELALRELAPARVVADSAPGLGTVASLRREVADLAWAESGWDDPAVLVLTAGSTGKPKTVVLTHGNILSRSAATALANALSTKTTTFNWMPLDHVSGLVMFHLRDTFLACEQIHAKKSWVLADPARWLDAIVRYRADTTWATNSSFDRLCEQVSNSPSRSWDLSGLRYVMNGGEVVRARTVARFLATFSPFGLPATAMRPGWGMSETASGILDHRIDADTVRADDLRVPVGKPHPGVAVRVVDGDGAVLPQGTIGRLQVRGAPVTPGYHSLTAAQNRRLFSVDGWFETGDMAFVADDVLTVTGSAGDLLSVGGRSLHAAEIESVVNELPCVEKGYTVAFAVSGGLVLCYVASASFEPADADGIRDLVQARCGVVVAGLVPVTKKDVPRSGTGKPQRADMRELLTGVLA